MNRETIEQAARDYIKPTASIIPVAESIAAKEGFIAGANWRINSVWHDSEAKCETNRKVLVAFKIGYFALFDDLRDLWTGEDDLWQEVEMFAYLDDLLPGGKEGTK